MFINGAWLHSVKTPTFRSAYGVSEELEDLIEKQLFTILDTGIQYAEHGKIPHTEYSKHLDSVGRFGLSALRPGVQENSIRALKKMIQQIQCMRDLNDISAMLGNFCKYRITSLLSFFVYYDPGKVIYVKPALGTGELGLPDPSYYFKSAPGKSKTLFAYGAMLDKFSELLELDEKLSAVIPMEFFFASEYLRTQAQKEQYMKGSELQEKFSTIQWDFFWKSFDISDWKSTTFKVYPPGWIKAVSKGLRKFTLQDWKLLLITHLILHAVKVLPPPFDDIHSAFYEKRLRGQTKKLPQRQLTIRLLNEWMPETLSRLYLKEFVNPNQKKEVFIFVRSIQDAALNRLQNTKWLDNSTKNKAILKVKKMKLGVAYPDRMPDFEELNLQTDNLFHNILLLGEDHTKSDLSKLHKPFNIEKEWDDAIYAVNAYYYSEVNQMIIPSGSLLWPFYDANAPLGWNYGGLGAVIGHEMTHAFDSDGKLYDENGKETNWWTLSDNREYNKRTKSIIQLYNQARVLGHPVSGALTLNENISDLGGLAIALDALHHAIKKLNISKEEQKKAFQNFFTAYAVSWRIKEKPQKIIQGLFMDRHAPAPLRVNLIVSQFDEWYEAFDIQVSDKLYIPPEERLRIF